VGLSRSFIDAHISRWEGELAAGGIYPHRVKWPRHLFHHAPLENALAILRSGQLLSRNDSAGRRSRDIAGAGVIDSSPRAHQYARLYFRPRTPTQYHIEGIRRLGECAYGENAHAPVLIMFVFEARAVLASEGVHFSDCNMQTGAIEGRTEAYFSDIPFKKVYHEGGLGGDMSIIRHRCAEVLARSPLNIFDAIARVYCRSDAERVTLLQALGSDASKWHKLIWVSDDLKVFERRYAFVESVSISNQGILFRLNRRHDGEKIALTLKAYRDDGVLVVLFETTAIDAWPNPTGSWRVDAKLGAGIYRIVITLEEDLAFDALLRLDDAPF
jgi:hypothetical protein